MAPNDNFWNAFRKQGGGMSADLQKGARIKAEAVDEGRRALKVLGITTSSSPVNIAETLATTGPLNAQASAAVITGLRTVEATQTPQQKFQTEMAYSVGTTISQLAQWLPKK